MFPVRCFTCGKVIGHLWEDYQSRLDDGKSPREALNELGIERYCCRRMFLTYRSVIKEISKFKGIEI
jgi:DNA-directed RNA polymerase subunit N